VISANKMPDVDLAIRHPAFVDVQQQRLNCAFCAFAAEFSNFDCRISIGFHGTLRAQLLKSTIENRKSKIQPVRLRQGFGATAPKPFGAGDKGITLPASASENVPRL
jgi:hypothetical protein